MPVVHVFTEQKCSGVDQDSRFKNPTERLEIRLDKRHWRAWIGLHHLTPRQLARNPSVALAAHMGKSRYTTAKYIRELVEIGLAEKDSHRGGVRPVLAEVDINVMDTSDANAVLRWHRSVNERERLDLLPLGSRDLRQQAIDTSAGAQCIDQQRSVNDVAKNSHPEEDEMSRKKLLAKLNKTARRVNSKSDSELKRRDTWIATALRTMMGIWSEHYEESFTEEFRVTRGRQNKFAKACKELKQRHIQIRHYREYVDWVWDTIHERRGYETPHITDLYAHDSLRRFVEHKGGMVLDIYALREILMQEGGFDAERVMSARYAVEVAESLRKGKRGIYKGWEKGAMVLWIKENWGKLPYAFADEYEEKDAKTRFEEAKARIEQMECQSEAVRRSYEEDNPELDGEIDDLMGQLESKLKKPTKRQEEYKQGQIAEARKRRAARAAKRRARREQG